MTLKNAQLQLKVVLITIFISVDIICLAKSEPTFAYMTKFEECGEFFDGIATINGTDSYIFINRKGEEIGEAPGMMIHSDSFCRIFDCGKKNLLTDKNNKVIKKIKMTLHLLQKVYIFFPLVLAKAGS